MIFALCLLFLAGLAGAAISKETSGLVYKEMRPQKTPFDPGKIPDPFLSYLIRRSREASEKAADERKKMLAAEERLKRRKLAAAERLKALKEPKTELQKMSLSQLTLTAIVQAADAAWAMVRDERGRGFVLKKGTHIGTNGGVVSKIAINQKKVIIKEPYLEKGLYIRYRPVEIGLPEQVYD
jgi:hypothetical protein